MPDHDGGTHGGQHGGTHGGQHGSLFGGVFARGTDTSDTAWLQAMLDAEAGLARALERAGLAPAGAGAAITAAAKAADFDVAELGELSALTGNPVPGLARALTRRVDGPAAGAVHRGATSQDILDTAAMLLARSAINVTKADLERAADAAANLAESHRATLMIGRTLLQQAVPVTFGVVAAGWLAGLDAAIDGLTTVRETRLAVQFGGAAGTLASLDADGVRVKALLAEELGLPDPPLPWHTERLRVIDVATAMARVTATLSKVARDITLLAQTEVAEAAEGGPPSTGRASTGEQQGGAAPRRGGSSAMPNKNNPVAAVAILGCAKQVPGLLATLVASAEQEHQRAAGAWHAEWQPFSDILRLAGSAAAWGGDLLSHLDVDTAKMAANLTAAGGLPLTERVTALLRNALGGPQAHDLVAIAAARSTSSGLPLRDVLLASPELEGKLASAGITADQIEAALDPAGYLGSSNEFITAALAAHGRLVSANRPTGLCQQEGERPSMDDEERTEQGMRVRRAVLGDAHVDRAIMNSTEFTAPFQDFITRYAWGEIWSRPGLSRPERSIITLTVLAALQHEDELAMHTKAALRNGLRAEQIQEVLLQVGLYAGVPVANRAFAIANRAIKEHQQDEQEHPG